MFDENTLQHFLSPFDESKHTRLLDVYIMSLGEHLETCQNALQNKDSVALKASVHDVKSLGYTLGAQALGERAEAAEMAIIENRETEAFDCCPDLFEHMKTVRALLETTRSKLD